jgi:hypothetical protein
MASCWNSPFELARPGQPLAVSDTASNSWKILAVVYSAAASSTLS